MDVRGGGAAAEDRRVIKDGYESDGDETKPASMDYSGVPQFTSVREREAPAVRAHAQVRLRVCRSWTCVEVCWFLHQRVPGCNGLPSQQFSCTCSNMSGHWQRLCTCWQPPFPTSLQPCDGACLIRVIRLW